MFLADERLSNVSPPKLLGMRSDIGGESCVVRSDNNNKQSRSAPRPAQSVNMCLDRQRLFDIIPARKRSPARIQRKIKAVINLNKFWSELEETYRSRTSSRVLVWKVETDTEELENNINENIERQRNSRVSPYQEES